MVTISDYCALCGRCANLKLMIFRFGHLIDIQDTKPTNSSTETNVNGKILVMWTWKVGHTQFCIQQHSQGCIIIIGGGCAHRA